MCLHWINHSGGHLARSPLGLYLTYQSFDLESGALCWFGKFEIDGKLLGFGPFDTLKIAQQSCENHAQKLEA